MDNAAGRYTLVFLGTSENSEGMVELTYNWDPEVYTEGRNFGHLAFQVEDIYAMCQKLMDAGITLNRPPTRWPYGLCSIPRQYFYRTPSSG